MRPPFFGPFRDWGCIVVVKERVPVVPEVKLFLASAREPFVQRDELSVNWMRIQGGGGARGKEEGGGLPRKL